MDGLYRLEARWREGEEEVLGVYRNVIELLLALLAAIAGGAEEVRVRRLLNRDPSPVLPKW